jgi:hypothetical protein
MSCTVFTPTGQGPAADVSSGTRRSLLLPQPATSDGAPAASPPVELASLVPLTPDDPPELPLDWPDGAPELVPFELELPPLDVGVKPPPPLELAPPPTLVPMPAPLPDEQAPMLARHPTTKAQRHFMPRVHMSESGRWPMVNRHESTRPHGAI